MMAPCSVKAYGGNLGLRCFPGTGRKVRPAHRLSLGALGIEDDPLATQEEDRAGDALNTHGMLRLRQRVWRIRSNAGNSRLIGS
jgi:hypothetical protein